MQIMDARCVRLDAERYEALEARPIVKDAKDKFSEIGLSLAKRPSRLYILCTVISTIRKLGHE
jgi:hypothetical protein